MDIGILSTPLDHPDLIEIPLYNEPFLLFDRADRTNGIVKDINNIDGNRLWLLDEGHCMRAQVETICSLKKRRAINSNMEYKTGTIDTLMRFVKKNNGVTLLPYLSTIDFFAEDKVFLKTFKAPVPARTISLVVHKHFVKKNILELLKQEILNCVNSILKKKSGKEILISPV